MIIIIIIGWCYYYFSPIGNNFLIIVDGKDIKESYYLIF